MRILLFLLMLVAPVLAQPSSAIKTIEWSVVQAEDGQRIQAHVTFTAPAPADAKIIFEPAFHLELPTEVAVPPGVTTLDIPLKVVDNRFLNGDRPEVPKVHATYNGQSWEGEGPKVVR